MTDNRTRYAVTITFDDGDSYNGYVTAYDRFGAFRMALQDARMGHPSGSFYSPVKTWDAVIDELETTE